jgi:hypothetical protein
MRSTIASSQQHAASSDIVNAILYLDDAIRDGPNPARRRRPERRSLKHYRGATGCAPYLNHQ